MKMKKLFLILTAVALSSCAWAKDLAKDKYMRVELSWAGDVYVTPEKIFTICWEDETCTEHDRGSFRLDENGWFYYDETMCIPCLTAVRLGGNCKTDEYAQKQGYFYNPWFGAKYSATSALSENTRGRLRHLRERKPRHIRLRAHKPLRKRGHEGRGLHDSRGEGVLRGRNRNKLTFLDSSSILSECAGMPTQESKKSTGIYQTNLPRQSHPRRSTMKIRHQLIVSHTASRYQPCSFLQSSQSSRNKTACSRKSRNFQNSRSKT